MTASRLLVVLALAGAGCHRSQAIDVTPITAESDGLKKNESDLLGERGALQRERKKIADARAEIVDRRKQLGHDSAGQAVLDEEEKKLLAQETEIATRESQVNAKLDDLLRLRSELVTRATQAVATAPGADPLERAVKREQAAAAREQAIATREHEVARREADVGEREKALADREARQARREKETCGSVAVAPPPKLELPKGLKYSAHDVEPVYKRALKVMEDRGLLSADLPPGAARLVDETREAMKSADYVRAKYDADQLLATVEEVKIDRGFISAKMARLAEAMRGRKLEGAERKAVESLFQEATAHYGDGKFPQANVKINRLFAMLK
jgi:hypothetical protein